MKPPSGSVGASAAARPLPARLGDDHLGANLVKALPEFCSLQIYPRRLGRGQRGPWPGQDRRRGPFRRASRGRQRGSARQEAVLTAAWTAKGRERTGEGSRGEAARKEGPPRRAVERKSTEGKGEASSAFGDTKRTVPSIDVPLSPDGALGPPDPQIQNPGEGLCQAKAPKVFALPQGVGHTPDGLTQVPGYSPKADS